MRYRPVGRRAGVAILAAAALCAVTGYGAAPAAGTAAVAASTPSIEFANPNSQALFGTAYQAALKNVLQTNTITADPAHYNKSGLLDPDIGIVRAGGGYPQPWTRDASVNSWNATSLLSPALAKNTLWSVVEKDAGGNLQVQQDDQQWDQVIWVTAAWNQYLVTGDRSFLENAYRTAADTVTIREHASTAGFNPAYGLFTGASFFNDGIAGYPAPPADATESVSTGSMPWPGVSTGMFLSTNEVYYAAYVNLANMAEKLGRPGQEAASYRAKANALKSAINKHFWNQQTGLYNYLVLADGTTGAYQEGTGLAFALIFGIANPAQARSILAHATEMTWGMPDTYPNWARYSDAQPGRHNAIVWPVVQGFWAKALAQQGEQNGFAAETARLAELADGNSGFWEIYNGNTGVVDGGWQRLGDTVKFHWGSQPDQTWSATAFLDMIHTGLFGLDFTDSGLSFTPDLPAGWGDVTLRDLHYRNADLTIALHGAGTRIGSFTIDGRRAFRSEIPASLSGKHTIDITLTGATAGDRDGDQVPDARDLCPDTAGTATLRGCPDPAHIEAEDALNTGGVKTNVNHTGYSGRAFLDGLWAQGASSAFTVHRTTAAAGTGSITLRYANANNEARTMTVSVDGTPVRQVSFPRVSSSWDDWGTVTFGDIPVSGLNPVITVSYAAGDSGSINLDWLEYRAAN
ncbi:MGH1-like glycoside hydrolase domain-containing protein [Amycolatopsis pithecellobii]|uniref:Bacterial alpha-L-rhamnosidase n=1 Tax=Amycolatopsis pithecellobii TaxID=664692 RepID=A0A6N7YZW0_9PSEU|nr:trehalase family glycosidase [Amycolatopsis pithecellobii]MTD54493.1 Bacterial alpha-L-rhamnosidase [Amycolatopsis pithecellobii]